MKEKRIQIDGQDTAYIVREDGTIWSEKRHRILKGTIERNEYHTVYLMHNGKQYNLMVHRIVADAFCDNPNHYNIVHHIDGNKLNNNASNLQWVTNQENCEAVTERKKPIKKQKAELLKEWFPLAINPTYAVNKDGEIANLKTGYLIQGSERNGYLRVEINGKPYSIHHLVFETFYGYNPQIIDHIDGNRHNNALNNLREVTQSQNMSYTMINGHSGQIPILQYDKQGNFIKEFPTIQAAADEMGVTHAAIRSALQRGGSSCGFYWIKKEK